MKWLMIVLGLVLFAFHQDCWNWNKFEPFWLGFLPVGITYHLLYAVACAIYMALLVRFCWPKKLEKYEAIAPARPE